MYVESQNIYTYSKISQSFALKDSAESVSDLKYRCLCVRASERDETIVWRDPMYTRIHARTHCHIERLACACGCGRASTYV